MKWKGAESFDRPGFWEEKKGTPEMKITASQAFKEAKAVLGNVLLRTLTGAEKSACEKLSLGWKSLADWSTGSYESSYKTFVRSSLKYDEAKHALRSLNMARLDAQCLQFCAAGKNLCEKQEILKRWSDKHKTYDVTKEKFLFKDREYVEAVNRFIELGICSCHCYHDCYDESVRDYTFYLQKLEKCNERIREFKNMKTKMDLETYTKYKKWLNECRKDTEKKMINAKIDVEELRRRIVHFHHDFHDSATEVLEFLRVRIPEYERLSKQHIDVTIIRNAVEGLHKKSVQGLDMLEECLRLEKDKLPKFEDRKYVERLVSANLKVYDLPGERTTESQGITRGTTHGTRGTQGTHEKMTGTQGASIRIGVGGEK
jgi:hypothetical protein